MEDDQNERQQNGRRTIWKMIRMEDNKNGGQQKWKTTKMENMVRGKLRLT